MLKEIISLLNKNCNLVVESLSCIRFEEEDDSIILIDMIKNKMYQINILTLDICKSFDGNKSIFDIAQQISNKYETDIDEVITDIYTIVEFLYSNDLILIKGTLKYMLLKFVCRILFIS